MTSLDLVPPLPPGGPDDVDGLIRFDSPLGRIEVVSRHDAIVALAVERDHHLPHDDRDETPDELVHAARRQLQDYFAGVRREFELPLRLEGTPFQRSVWAALQQLAFGRSTTYGLIAAAIGRPQAGRAVGGAIAANPLPLLVPCHRVLGRTGGVTGYTIGSGIPTKQWLLGHEGIVYRSGPMPVD
ncbi:methylated-DNA--[protein]-cysteine S-methyltransferase [Frigoribacterium sp. 2-23]|uniref:methylated-DNA--[protein]-cysteine S-methyltransferase n=1 Tax=Frigoribacterium sp. 2-23 TaxID=3415006 RepID=UPI003C6EEEB5